MATPTVAEAARTKLLLTVAEAGALLGLGRNYVYTSLVQPGTIRSFKIGRRRLIARRDLEAYVDGLVAAERGEEGNDCA